MIKIGRVGTGIPAITFLASELVMRNPVCLYRAKYYRAERADAAFVSPPFADCETADKWLTRKLSEGATGGHIEIAYVDVPADVWELPAMSEVGAA